MIELTATVGSPVGLHARPARLFTQAVSGAGFPVTLSIGEKRVNAASILGVLSLGIGFGDNVTLTTTDDSKKDELAGLAEMLGRNLDES